MNNVFKPIKYLRGPLIVVSRVYHLYIHEIYIKRGDMVFRQNFLKIRTLKFYYGVRRALKMK